MSSLILEEHEGPKLSIPLPVKIIAIGMSLFQLYTGIFQLTAMNQRVPHVTLALMLVFLFFGFGQKKQEKIAWHGYLMAAGSLFLGLYVLTTWFSKVGVVGNSLPVHELILGTIFILLCIEAGRRTLGWVFPIISIISMVYARFGEWLPGILAHKNYSLERVVGSMFITTDGVFGMLTGISSTYIFLFILFGTMLREAGGGNFFINLSYSLFGNVRGGPAKIAVVGSSLFGMISGSGTANVAGVGQITIPLMIRTGYKPHFAAAVEAVSSAGGLLMPPVMGSAVFVIMEILGVNYVTLMKAAALPAILYYLGVFLMVDIEAQKEGMKGLPREELPRFKDVLKEGWFYFIPVFVLILSLTVSRVSVTRAAFWATISIPLCCVLGGRAKIMGVKQIMRGLQNGALTALPVVVILTLAGIVLGMITLTGLGLMISSMLITLSGGHLLPLLILTMIASIILGMGVPPVAAYIVLAILVIPALIQMGVTPLAAHMFVFYFSIIAGITPPMAPDAYVAAGIAEAPMMRTAFTACRLSLVIFLVPYIFVYSNTLLLVGGFGEIVLATITSALGVYFLAYGLQGYFKGPLPFYMRILLVASGVLLIVPGWITDLIGIAIGATIFLIRFSRPVKELSAFGTAGGLDSHD
jgi:TRAP transporter 4TM/12TM fusion protein